MLISSGKVSDYFFLVNLKFYNILYIFSDIRFIVGEERQVIYAHKCLLAARCEVFKAMFAVKEGESAAPLVLSDIRPQIFLAVLEFIYTNCSSLSTDMVIDALAASIEYGLEGLTKVSRVCLEGGLVFRVSQFNVAQPLCILGGRDIAHVQHRNRNDFYPCIG